ncbi:MAG: CxxC-x17-CxxC domain-containing protein [Candidatus Margulisiibacteriota bacterium]
MKSKRKESKRSQDKTAADQDVIGLLTTLVQKLTSFEAKIDTVLSRIPPQPFPAPRQQPIQIPQPERRRESRPMHKAVCADCGTDCEVPFKPSGGRPVYCKKCFAARKNNGTFKPWGDKRPKEEQPVSVLSPEKPKAAKPTKPVKKKKPAAKKKKK